MTSVTQAGITISIENNIQVIRFNNPRQRNPVQSDAPSFITKALEDAAENPDVRFTVLTGTGDYYSSGLYLTGGSSKSTRSEDRMRDFKNMIEAFIDYPKLMVAIVNGPAIGVAVTILGLCDIVYATDNATFTTPFSKLGLCAEACASYTFPQILGRSKANEMLLVGQKMTAEEALQFGFISKIFKQSDVSEIWEHIAQFKNVSQQSILVSKKLIRNFDREILKRTCEMEMKSFKICQESEYFSFAVTRFFNRKSKL